MNIKPNQFVSRFLVGGVVVAAMATTAAAEIFQVPQEFPTISAAIAKARDNDVIMVDAGVYEGFIWGNKVVTVQSIMGPELTQIVGGVIFDTADKGVARRLEGFTITGPVNGIYSNKGGGGQVVSCIIRDNEFSGVRVYESTVQLQNCLIVHNNISWMFGGGILNDSGIVHAVNLTVADNMGLHSAGIHDYSHFGQSTYDNCIVWNNGPVGIVGNAQFRYCNTEQWEEGIHNISVDPGFTDPFSFNYRLHEGSACIDAGNNLAVPQELIRDLACHARFIDDPLTKDTGNGTPPIVDLGAYEFQRDEVCLMMTVDSTCPMAGKAVIEWTGSTPKASMALIFSTHSGPYRIPDGQACGGSFITLQPPGLVVMSGLQFTSNGAGNGIAIGQMPARACGGWLQLLDLNNCTMSNSVRLP
jgi:hypothetical protein